MFWNDFEMEFSGGPWDFYNKFENDIFQAEKDMNQIYRKMQQVLSKLEDAQNQKSELAQRISVVCAEKEKLKQQFSKMKAQVEENSTTSKDLQKAIQLKQNELQSLADEDHLVQKFRAALSFHCKSVKGEALALIFKNIDKSNPERVFEVDIAINDNTFTVVQCSPRVSSLRDLEKELATSNNLSRFVVKLRRAWVASLTTPDAL